MAAVGGVALGRLGAGLAEGRTVFAVAGHRGHLSAQADADVGVQGAA